MKTYIFKTKFLRAKSISRTIEVPGHFSLEDLAKAIVESYDFDLDHCYGFYSKIKGRCYDSEEKYELFADLDDVEPTNAKSVMHTTTNQVKAFSKKKGSMLFLFDYGDNWEFIIEVKDFGTEKKEIKYPHLISSKGEAPEQYPNYDDEE